MYIWPTVIILIALVTIFSAFGGRRRHYTTGDGVRYSAIFGETKEAVRDQNVQKISVSATFGGVELDMTQAGIQNEAAVVDVFVLFGSADIIVPENWAVEVRVTPILGGVENKTRPSDHQQKKLLLTGSVMFGGASVRAR
ncbi:MAG: LiaF domain-containing protein [Bacillota bacterium]